jgi:hypothetical protein
MCSISTVYVCASIGTAAEQSRGAREAASTYTAEAHQGIMQHNATLLARIPLVTVHCSEEKKTSKL